MHPDPSDQPENEGYEMEVPFVVCASVGGPYEDDAFVAGFQAGQIDQALRVAAAANASEARFTVNTELVKQLELIGMHRGFPVMVAEVADSTPTWTFVTFRVDTPANDTTP